MSGVSDGQYADEDAFNAAFMARNGDTSTVGKVALENDDVESGDHIANVQKYVNQLADTDGVAGEDDASRKVYSSTNYIANGDNRKVAIGKLDAQLDTTQGEVDDHETRLDDIETQNSSFGGNKTFTGSVIVQGDLTVQGTMTAIDTDNLEVEDKNILINKGGNNATAEASGIDVQRTSDNGVFRFDSALASYWKLGIASAMREIIVSGVAQIIAGLKRFADGIATDTIAEETAAAGVTVDGVLLKDGLTDGRDVSADGTVLDAHVANTSNPHTVTKTQVGLGNVTDDAQLKRAAADFATFTTKGSPDGGDYVLIEDNQDSGNKKKVLISAITSAATTTIVRATTGTNYSVSSADDEVYATAAAVTITLRAANAASPKPVTIVNVSTGSITVTRSGADTILGETSQTMNPDDVVTFMPDGTSKYYVR